MKTLLTHTYFLEEDPKEKLINKPYPPLGLLYLSAWLDQHNQENEVFDSTFTTAIAQRQYILAHPPKVIAIYANLITKLNVIDLIGFIKKEAALKDVLIVLGGPDVTYNVNNYLDAGADVLILGEGEQSLLDLIIAHDNGLRPHFGHISGLAFKDADGVVLKTKARTHLRNINELPFPNRKKIKLDNYLNLWKKHHGQSSISISTQRGCPYTCKWCSTAVYGQSYRRRSPALVVEEMRQLKEEYEFDQIWFVDDVFTVSHKWLEAFRDELKKQKIAIPFECITRADRMNENVIQLLKESACFRIWIGAESGSQRIIDAMDRRVKASKVQDMIRATRAAGMEAGTFIMLGYPGETEKDIKITLRHLKKANPDHFTITITYPIRGTSLYEEVAHDLIDDLDWSQSTDRDLDFKRTYPRRYYDFAVRWVVNGLNLHKQISAGRPEITSSIKHAIKFILARFGMFWYRLVSVCLNTKS